MTAQISESLFFDGKKVALLSNPLSDYFDLGGRNPGFQATCTALWRGYVGTWEILNDRLYLIALHGTLESGEEANLETVFPGFPHRVFVHWFSGQLRIPQGKRLKYVHMGYGSTYEQDMLLDLRNGVVVKQDVVVNGIAPDDVQPGYGIAGATSWPARKSANASEGEA